MRQNDVRVALQAESEVVVCVPYEEQRGAATVMLMPSNAAYEPRVDVHGAPLAVDTPYMLLPGATLHCYAWTNAVLRVAGSTRLLRNVLRTAAPSLTRPLVEYHCRLHAARLRAAATRARGPLVLVCGDGATGAPGVVARTLCSYAARSGWKPMLVDLDCGVAQSLAPPGAIAAGIVEWPLTVDDVPSTSLVTLAHFVGSTDAQRATRNGWVVTPAYAHYVQLLLDTVVARLTYHVDDVYGASGAIVALPTLRDVEGGNFVVDLVQRYGVTHALCLGDDGLLHKLLHLAATSAGDDHDDDGNEDTGARATALHVDKVASLASLVPRAMRDEALLPRRLADFFYGAGAITLQPSQWTRPLHLLDVLQLREDSEPVALVAVERSALAYLVGCVGALFRAHKTPNMLHNNPLAFARVQAVDAAGVALLTTAHDTFAGERLTLIVGALRWITSS